MGESPPTTAATSRTRRHRVAGMSTADCAGRVERALWAVPGVESATVDLDRSEVLIRTAADVDEATLAQAVERVGYTLLANANDQDEQREPFSVPDGPASGAFEPADDDASRSWRARLPPFAAVWYFLTRAAMAGLIFSLVLTLLYRFAAPPFTLLMMDRSIFGGNAIYQNWVPLERISPNLVRAVVASEDNEFCRHWGFDFAELQDAWDSARNGGRLRGASTISQQTAKNVFLWSGRSYVRKGLEAYFTVLIEAIWPKRRIMEVYLNVIEWGPGIFGAEAASLHWFGKSAARLSPLEAGRLAAILPNPKKYRARPAGPYVVDRAYTIAARSNNVDLGGADRCTRP